MEKALQQKFYLLIAVIYLFGTLSCSTSTNQINSNYEERIIELGANLAVDSNNIDLLREYSNLLVLSKQHDKAVYYLDKALELSPNDPAILFNKGLNFEFLNDTLNAIQTYARYREVPSSAEYREMMQGRFLILSREAFKREVKGILHEGSLPPIDELSNNNIAVFPLDYLGLDDKYSVLGTGFSEMISIDLGKVKDLTILERIRLNTVLKELKFGQTKFVDQKTAPRVGKLVNAGKLYDGIINIDEEEQINIELSYWDIIKNVRSNVIKRDGGIVELFLLEKEIVFDILEQLEIKISPEEKENIEFIPTENINAFLAYSKGLELENEGRFSEAADFFREAIISDPNFSDAAKKLNENENIVLCEAGKESLLETVEEIEFGNRLKTNIVEERLNKQSQLMRSTFVNTIENRNSVQDSEEGLIELPPPPPPKKK